MATTFLDGALQLDPFCAGRGARHELVEPGLEPRPKRRILTFQRRYFRDQGLTRAISARSNASFSEPFSEARSGGGVIHTSTHIRCQCASPLTHPESVRRTDPKKRGPEQLLAIHGR
jgi:hypothetical protein